MTDNAIQLVCFDLGRVLIRIGDSWAEACAAAGVAPAVTTMDGPTRQTFLHIVAAHETGELDESGFAERVAALTGAEPDGALAVLTGWLRGAYDGAAELIEALSDRPVQTACLSNTNACHWRLMTGGEGPNALPLDRLDHRFASHLIGRRKPDPAIYQHVERATGVAPGSILFFDDSPENVHAAGQRGWRGHTIEHPGDPVRQVRRQLDRLGLLNGTDP